MTASPAPHRYDLLIIEAHLDTFGHVNNATYFALFEEARWALLTERGYGLDKIQATRKGPVILEATIQFQKELRNREQVTIETTSTKNEGKIGWVVQRMLKSNGDVACEARFKMALWDLDSRKLILPTPEWNAVLHGDTR